MNHSPAEFRQLVALHAQSTTDATARLLNALGYSDEYVRLCKRDVKMAISTLRETADELSTALAQVTDKTEPSSE